MEVSELSVLILQRRLEADPPGPGISCDIVLKSISDTNSEEEELFKEVVELAEIITEQLESSSEDSSEIEADLDSETFDD